MEKKGQKHVDNFWKLSREEYLLSLRERSQTNLKGPRTHSLFSANVGDVILIKDDLPRRSWRMGRIQDLIISRDGQIRSAKILLPSKKILGWPLSLLYPRECQPKDTDTNWLKREESPSVSREQNNNTGNKSKLDNEHVSIQRPKRQAAYEARPWNGQ